MTNSGETAVVVALSAAYGGSVIARRDGRVVFVKGAIPGERVCIRIVERKAWYDTAEVIGIEAASPLRVEPACSYAGSCGGCQLQHLSHTGQLSLKDDVLRDCLTRIGGMDVVLSPPLHDAGPWAYRVRGQFKVAGSAIGFFREKSRHLVGIASCPLMTGEVNESLRVFSKILRGWAGHTPREPWVSEAHITCGDVPVLLLKTGQEEADSRVLRGAASELIEGGFSGVAVQTKQGKVLSRGALRSTFRLGRLSYLISPLSFLQSHWRLNQVVADFLKESLRPLSGKRVIDLYAGAGNLSLPLCDEADEVVCVEADPWAVRDGRRNASLNGMNNCRFVHADASDALSGLSTDILILDPPRTGLANKVIERIKALRARRIAYISCNPATLARDLKKLAGMYRIGSVRAIDFFPQTFHIEAMAFLEMK